MKKLILFANAVVLAALLSSCGNAKENADTTGADSTAVDSSAMNTQPEQ